jgi:hypothetical protein
MIGRTGAVFLIAGVVAAAPAGAQQQWNDPRTRSLVEQATERRAQQIADTLLASYKAAAHGYLTFLAQVGEGFTEPPKIVKADELGLQIFWQAPNRSKQLIAARRDTLLLPTDINYHRDHLGIVQNNFPSTIRLGEGDEVRDVPHPLSAQGLSEYDFAIRDSLQIRLGPRTLNVYEVRVRPKNDRAARAIGAVYIDRESGEVVRMAFSFTRAALIDKELEDVSVVLENGLIDGRFWLPRRQEIEIRRTGEWLDYPARGIIRGRWEICCYEVNVPMPPGIFQGPEIALAPRGTPSPIPFVGNVLDSLPPDVRAVTDADVAKVQEEARALVRSQALARTRNVALSGRSVTDFVRVNRVEGLAVGTGITRWLGKGLSVSIRGRYGFADERAKERGGISYTHANGARIELTGYNDFRTAGDVAEASGVISSISAQEFGTDYSDPFGVRGAMLGFRSPRFSGLTLGLDAAIERQRGLAVNATPATGRYQEPIDAVSLRDRRLTLSLARPTRLAPLGFEARINLSGTILQYRESSDDYRTVYRTALEGDFERPVGRSRFIARTFAGFAGSKYRIPAQELIYVGGPSTAPGYVFHQFSGQGAVSQRLELDFPVAFPSFSLGRYGKTPASITLAPFVNAAWINRPESARLSPYENSPGWHPSAGLGALSIFDVLRLEVARGLRDGRWTFTADISRDLWSIL